MLQSGSVLFDPNALSVNRLFSWPARVHLAAVLALSLASAALPNLSWARSPQFDSAAPVSYTHLTLPTNREV